MPSSIPSPDQDAEDKAAKEKADALAQAQRDTQAPAPKSFGDMVGERLAAFSQGLSQFFESVWNAISEKFGIDTKKATFSAEEGAKPAPGADELQVPAADIQKLQERLAGKTGAGWTPQFMIQGVTGFHETDINGKLDKNTIAATQRAMKHAGLYNGPIDGDVAAHPELVKAIIENNKNQKPEDRMSPEALAALTVYAEHHTVGQTTPAAEPQKTTAEKPVEPQVTTPTRTSQTLVAENPDVQEALKLSAHHITGGPPPAPTTYEYAINQLNSGLDAAKDLGGRALHLVTGGDNADHSVPAGHLVAGQNIQGGLALGGK